MKVHFSLMLFLALIAGQIGAQPAVRDVLVRGEPRQGPIKEVIIHATGGPDCDQSRSFRGGTLNGIVEHFRRNQGRISIHYIIGRTGETVRMVPESMVAFHVRGHNANSIGIELVNDGNGIDPFGEPQLDALVDLLREILARHQLDSTALKSHAELDDSFILCRGEQIKRKVDPGLAFPWDRIRTALQVKNNVAANKLQANEVATLFEPDRPVEQAAVRGSESSVPGGPAIHRSPALPRASQTPTGPSLTEERFLDHRDGTLSDQRTGLMWTARDNGEDISWLEAVRYVEELRFGGYSDWRLPSMQELAELLRETPNTRIPSRGCSGDYRIPSAFHLSCGVLWSSERQSHGAYAFNFASSEPRFDNPAEGGHRRVLAVRSE